MGYALGLRDGLTSSMDLEEGCAGPYVARWYAEREGGNQANFGCASSHEQARAIVLDGFDDEEALLLGPAAALQSRKGSGWSLTKAECAAISRRHRRTSWYVFRSPVQCRQPLCMSQSE